MILLNSFRCLEIVIPSFIFIVYTRCLKYNQLESDFFVYKLSSFFQRSAWVPLLANFRNILLERDNRIRLCAFSSSSFADGGSSIRHPFIQNFRQALLLSWDSDHHFNINFHKTCFVCSVRFDIYSSIISIRYRFLMDE